MSALIVFPLMILLAELAVNSLIAMGIALMMVLSARCLRLAMLRGKLWGLRLAFFVLLFFGALVLLVPLPLLANFNARASLFFLLPTAVMSFLYGVRVRKEDLPPRGVLIRALYALSIPLIVSGMWVALAVRFDRYAAAADAAGDQIVAALKAYKEQRGVYPPDLDELERTGLLVLSEPDVLRHYGYKPAALGDSFDLTYAPPGTALPMLQILQDDYRHYDSTGYWEPGYSDTSGWGGNNHDAEFTNPAPPRVPPTVTLAPGTARPVLPTSTRVPPTTTPVPPTATPIPPTATPQPQFRLAFTSVSKTWSMICLLDSNGSSQGCLTGKGSDNYDPTWRQDWRRLAFVSDRDGGNHEIYSMDADGRNPVRLTDNEAEDYMPAWAPGGLRLAFVSDRDGNLEIYVMDTDGSDVVNLTNNAAIDLDPAWSPDGRSLLFASNRDGNAEIYQMDADGRNVVRLTDNAAEDYLPAWSPDGKRIAFVSDRDGNQEIYVMDADGGNPVNLTHNAASDLSPAWSPDGKYIVFQSYRDENGEIYRMGADGSDPVNLTRSAADDSDPACAALSP